MIAAARTLLAAHRAHEAVALLLPHLEALRADAALWLCLAAAYRLLGDGPSAQQAAGTALELAPLRADVLLEAARVQLKFAPDGGEAEALCVRAGDSPEATALLGQVRGDEALLRAAVAAAPDCEAVQLALASSAAATVEDLAAAVRRLPRSAALHEAYAAALEAGGFQSGALAALQWGVEHCDDVPDNMVAALAIRHVELGDPAAAKRVFDELLFPRLAAPGRPDAALWPALVVASRLLGAGAHAAALDIVERPALRVPGTEGLCEQIAGEALGKRHSTLREAQRRFERSVALQPGKQEPLLGLVNVTRELGEFDEALRLSALADDSLFNRCQCLEHAYRHAEAVTLLSEHRARRQATPGLQPELHDYAISLLLTKLLFSAPCALAQGWLQHVPTLAAEWEGVPVATKLELQREVHTHWAYMVFVCALSPPPPPSLVDEVPVIGDSHCLSYAWREATVRGRHVRLVPRLVTGLKAHHMQAGYEYLTTRTLHTVMEGLTAGELALLVVGEIDCREGIAPAVDAGKYASDEEGVAATADVLVAAVGALSEQYGVQFLVLSPPPPSAPSPSSPAPLAGARQRALLREFNAALAERLGAQFVDVYSAVVAPGSDFVRPEFAADPVHCNGGVAAVLSTLDAAQP